LSTNSQYRQPLITDFTNQLVIEGNTIKKAYLSNSNITKINTGDLIFFYRTGDSFISNMGLVENIYQNQTDANIISRLVGKRTVYTFKEITYICRKPTLVILFTEVLDLNNPISLNQAKNAGILNGIPQSIMEIPENRYRILKNIAKIPNDLIISD
jgi:hypothetical protein